MASEEQGEKVTLFVYDLSQGMAKILSPSLIGKQIDGIWHTGIIVYGHEYYFGGGIQWSPPGQSVAGRPQQQIELGVTHIPQDMFHDFLREISPRFTPETYSLLHNNCNNFTSECSKFLVGRDIPDFIIGLPQDALSTPMGQSLRMMIMQFENNMKSNLGSHIVPWSESGGPLSLPPLSRRAAVPAASSSSSSTPATAAATTQPSSSVTAATSAMLNNAAPTTQEQKNAIDEVPDYAVAHAHSQLGLKKVSYQNKPFLSIDAKHTSFEALIKAASTKVKEIGLTDAEREVLRKVCDGLSNPSKSATEFLPAAYALFDRLITQWPKNQLFAVFGLFRLFVTSPQVNDHYYQHGDTINKIINMIHQSSTAESKDNNNNKMPSPAHVMALFTISNLFSKSVFGLKLSTDDQILDIAIHAVSSSDPALRTAGGALLFNISLFLPKEPSDSAIRAANVAIEMANQEQEPEACFRLLLALGHLMYCNDEIVVIVSTLSIETNTIKQKHAHAQQSHITKINDVINDIQKMIQIIN